MRGTRRNDHHRESTKEEEAWGEKSGARSCVAK